MMNLSFVHVPVGYYYAFFWDMSIQFPCSCLNWIIYSSKEVDALNAVRQPQLRILGIRLYSKEREESWDFWFLQLPSVGPCSLCISTYSLWIQRQLNYSSVTLFIQIWRRLVLPTTKISLIKIKLQCINTAFPFLIKKGLIRTQQTSRVNEASNGTVLD